MDVLAHGLWTNILFRIIPKTKNDKKTIWWGIVFGVLPDLASFTPLFIVLIWNLIIGQMTWQPGPPNFGNSALSIYAQQSYNYTHSFVICFFVIGLIWAVWRKFPWFLLGWVLHIAIDLFTHSDFYRTPFLFPLSGYRNPYGVSWAHPIFMGINYLTLVIFYLVLLPRLKKADGVSSFML